MEVEKTLYEIIQGIHNQAKNLDKTTKSYEYYKL